MDIHQMGGGDSLYNLLIQKVLKTLIFVAQWLLRMTEAITGNGSMICTGES
jgi:hypothetical protein